MNIRFSERMESDLFFGEVVGFCTSFFLLICFLNSFEGSSDFSFWSIVATLTILGFYIAVRCAVEKGLLAGLKSILGFGMGILLGALISPIVFFLEMWLVL